jgi:hypothetical protein
MESKALQQLLEQVSTGKVSPQDAYSSLKTFFYEDIKFAKIDHYRTVRTGYPEVIFCQGKTVDQITSIMQRLKEREPDRNILATRAVPEVYRATEKIIPEVQYNELAKVMYVQRTGPTCASEDYILVMSAGTADIPVAEEAALTAELMGYNVRRLYDVGVAGLHRLLDHLDLITSARVIIAVAGMEGALPSVVGGLVDKPVIAVPTSIGYGANLKGISALLSMLNGCAAGVTVVNIDNGFGAGYAAVLISRVNGK